MDPENDDDHQYMKNNLISLTTHNDSNTSCNVQFASQSQFALLQAIKTERTSSD